MTRPHIEFIQQQDQPWAQEALFPDLAALSCKMLSRDNENGAFTALAQCPAGWQSDGPFALSTAVELYLIDGHMQVEATGNNYQLKKGCYLRVDKAIAWQAIRMEKAGEFLMMADRQPVRDDGIGDAESAVTFVDTSLLEWETPWVKGPEPGLQIKLLFMNQESGAYSRLISADPGWTETRREHHDCVEEVYMLEGDMTMGGIGTMQHGGYIWRPPLIKHGPMKTRDGGVMFIRTDGPLVNHYTEG